MVWIEDVWSDPLFGVPVQGSQICENHFALKEEAKKQGLKYGRYLDTRDKPSQYPIPVYTLSSHKNLLLVQIIDEQCVFGTFQGH